MGGVGRDDEGDRGISSQHCNTDYRNDSKEGQRWGMGVGFGGCGVGGYITLDGQGISAEVSGKNCGLYSRETNIRNLYRRIEDGKFQ